MSEEKLGGFEEQLAGALKRVDAPKSFGDSVMRAVVREQQTAPSLVERFFASFEIPTWATGAVAAALIVGVLAVGQVHERHVRLQVEAQQRAEADREFETASRITDRALDHARRQMARVGVSPEE
jgi:hypothetical protein